ncbi:hypothetical protein BC829DRAFT_297655 [Chytridium lagenaria]|nr:hypothetical protein BC829DRAFT_297655 [Chytridium lagenaria]
MLEMELRKLEERKAGQIDGDDGGKKKKPKKKKSKAKTLGGDDMEDEDVTERPPSALSMAPKETKKSGGKNAVEATSIAPAHSPQHSLEKANGAGVKQGKTAAAAVKPVVIAGDVAPLDRPSITKATPVSEISSKAPSSAPFEEKSSKEPSRTVPLPSSAAVPTAPTTAAAIPPANQTATPSKKKGGKKDAKKVTKPSDPAVPTPFKQETPVSAEEKVTEPAVLEPTATPIEPAVLELTATSIEPALNDRVFTEPTDSTAQSDTQTFLDNNPSFTPFDPKSLPSNPISVAH